MPFGSPDDFDIFNNSKLRSAIRKQGLVLDLPVLADRITKKFFNDRITYGEIAAKGLMGERTEAQRWLDATRTEFSKGFV